MRCLWIVCMIVANQIDAKTETMNVNVYAGLLAGGVGERLWPLSRQDHPKQFLSIGSSENLLEQAINRLEGVVSQDKRWVIASRFHVEHIGKDLQQKIGHTLVEPLGRNTGPALLYACMELYKKDPQAIVVFVPADPYIPQSDYALFRSSLHQAIAFAAQHDGIVLCGAKPSYAATGYGYIEHTTSPEYAPFFSVQRFHEKPSLALAKNYIQQPHMLWNTGMFIGKVSVFLDEYQRVAPDLFAELQQFQKGQKQYADISSISVDCAVMEKSNNVWVLPVDFSWCDVGNINVFLSIKETTAAMKQSDIVSIESHNNLVEVPNKLVALVGVDDLCIVETADALLITKRTEAEKVRSVVATLKEKQQIEYL